MIATHESGNVPLKFDRMMIPILRHGALGRLCGADWTLTTATISRCDDSKFAERNEVDEVTGFDVGPVLGYVDQTIGRPETGYET